MIRVENLTKYYGQRLAVDNISFNVAKGEIVGLLGPNAAGKTTTMRILTGFLTPTRGNAYIADFNMVTNSLEGRRRIGYMPESIPLYTDMKVRDYLTFFAKLRGVENVNVKARIDEVVQTCHLEEYIDVIVGKLSRGFRQRVGLAQAIIHDPDVLILDEPTVGIDPIQVAQTRNLIKELGKQHTVLISTHILPEVSIICERVIIIHRGKIVAEDNIENLSSVLRGSRRLKLEVKGPPDKVVAALRRVPGVKRVAREGTYYIIESPTETDPRSRVTETIVKNGWNLLSAETVDMSLEEIFLQLTKTKPSEEAAAGEEGTAR
jgi:ABC-2 type transport system ATP-binding protein